MLATMPVTPALPPALAGRVFRGTEAVRDGLITRAQLQSRAWRRIRHDVYADARLEPDHALACHAVRLRLPAVTFFAGPSAAFLHGVEHAATFEDDVHVITPASVRLGSQRSLRIHHFDLHPEEVITGIQRAASVHSARSLTGPPLPRTTAARTAWDVAAWLDPVDAVPIVDTLLGRELVSRAELAALTSRHAGRPGCRRAELVFDLADPAAQSPRESVLRVRLVLGGLPRPVAQCPVRVPSGLLLHPDLAWQEWQVAVEYDGHWHADPDQSHRDRHRLNLLTVAGWTVLHVTSRRLHNDFPAVLNEVKSALFAKGWRPTRH